MRIRGTQPEMVKRALALGALVRQHADRAEAERRLPSEVAQAMAAEGLYRIAAPPWLGGADADPVTQIEIIEAISNADGATGWNLMIGIEAFGLIAPSLEGCAELVADPGVIMAGATSAMGRADEVPGGYCIEGQWQFVSGVHNSALFAGKERRVVHPAHELPAPFSGTERVNRSMSHRATPSYAARSSRFSIRGGSGGYAVRGHTIFGFRV